LLAGCQLENCRLGLVVRTNQIFIGTHGIKFCSPVSGYIPHPGYNPYKLLPKDPDGGTAGQLGFWARMTTALKYRKGASTGAQKEKKLWAVFMFLLLTNLPAALYTSLVHQVYPCSLTVRPVCVSDSAICQRNLPTSACY